MEDEINDPGSPDTLVIETECFAKIAELSKDPDVSDFHLDFGLNMIYRKCGVAFCDQTTHLDEKSLTEFLQQTRSEGIKDFHKPFTHEGAVTFCGRRYRFSIYTNLQQGAQSVTLNMRLLPQHIPTPEEIHLPEKFIETVCKEPNGLILVCGETGSGKSTSCAAALNERIRKVGDHVITIEQPIEYIFDNPAKGFRVHQREVGTHVESFEAALKYALRQDPDVIFVGELRDPSTTMTALAAADTGHLVIATVHTGTVDRSVDRLVSMCPDGDKNRAIAMLADRLRIVLAQRLLPRADGQGRIAIHELLVHSDAVRNHIMEGEYTHLRSELDLKKKDGNISFALSARMAYDNNFIDSEEFEYYEKKL